MSDTLSRGRKFRTLNVVDDFTREGHAIEVDTCSGSTCGAGAGTAEIAARSPAADPQRQRPRVYQSGAGSVGFEKRVEWHFIAPGKPIENGFVESFNGKFRDECLNENWFSRLAMRGRRSSIGGGITTKCGRTRRSAISHPRSLRRGARLRPSYARMAPPADGAASSGGESVIAGVVLENPNPEKVSLSLD